jgi:hypothetical protein
MRTLLLAFVAWVQGQFTRFNGCLGIIGAVTIVGYIVWGILFGLSWGGVIPTATAPTAAPTASATAAEPTATQAATATAVAAKPAKKPAAKQPTAVPVQVQATAVPTAAPPAPPAPTILVGEEGPCKGGSTNVHFVETREGIGNAGWMEYDVTIGTGEVALIWGSQIPGYGNGRSFLTVAGPWSGKIGVFNGAYRVGKVLTDLTQVQNFWADIIDCDLQRSLPIDQQKRGLYEKFRVNW